MAKTRSGTDIFLIGQPQQLKKTMLPTASEVLKHYYYQIESGFSRDNATSCKFVDQFKPACMNLPECENNCTLSSIKNIYERAGYPTMTYKSMKKKVSCLIDEHKKLVSYKARANPSQRVKEQNFKDSSLKLFDVAVPNLIDFITNDSARSESTKREDISFYNDQLNERRFAMGGGDKKYEEASNKIFLDTAKREERKRKREQYEIKQKTVIQPDPCNETDNYESDYSDSEFLPDPGPQTPKATKKTTELDISINIDTLIEKTSIICGRYNISSRAQTALIAQFLKCGNVNLDDVKFSKSKVDKIRAKTIEKEAIDIRNRVTEKCTNKRLFLHIDTKKVKSLTEDFVDQEIERFRF